MNGAMSAALAERMARAGEAAAARARETLAARIADEVPGARVTIEGQAVVVRSRGLARRWWQLPAIATPGGGR